MVEQVVPFINLQYIYCFIISLFGAKCTPANVSIDTSGIDGAIDGASGAINGALGTTSAASGSGGGFWSWLWPFGSSAGSGGAEVAGSSVGFWTGVLHALPEPVQAVLVAIGLTISFLWTLFSWLSFTASGLLFMLILSAVAGIVYIRIKEWGTYGTLPAKDPTKSYGYSRWQDLLNEAMSTDPKRWRAAIIAADGMLGDLLKQLDYRGEGTADRIRVVPEDAFVTLPAAWEAHRIKNFVAAKASNYILTQREAFRTMKLYEQVFEEFDFI